MAKEKKLDLFGIPYNIEYVHEIKDGDSCSYGLTTYCKHLVQVANTVYGEKLLAKEQRITLLHELFHVILTEGQYNQESHNEALVEWLAKCTNEIIEQKICQ